MTMVPLGPAWRTISCASRRLCQMYGNASDSTTLGNVTAANGKGWLASQQTAVASGAVNIRASHSFQKNMSASTTVRSGRSRVSTRVRCPDPPQRSSTRP